MEFQFGFQYESNERRQSVRVSLEGYLVQFIQNDKQYKCLDLSATGMALHTPMNIREDERQAFLLDYNNHIVGEVVASPIYQQDGRSGWQFTRVDRNVRNLIEELILQIQKKQLKAAKKIRDKNEEARLLGLPVDEPSEES